MRNGFVQAIYITEAAGQPTRSVQTIRAVPGLGLEGDRYFNLAASGNKKTGTGREITLIEIEALETLEHEAGIHLSPGDARRNVVTQGVSLNTLVGQEFQVGSITLRGIRLCEPCQYLAGMTHPQVLPGLVHRAGLRADILTEGMIHSGDPIIVPESNQAE